MVEKMLTIDIGNTRIKWAVWEGGQLVLDGDCEHKSVFTLELFESCIPVSEVINKICVANVAGESVVPALEQWAASRAIEDVVFLKVEKECCGVTIAYSEASSYGVDRWAALLGAKSIYKKDVCIIDIGTAVTVDFMNKEGQHHGGVIMPGLEIMQAALLENTAQISIDIKDCDENPMWLASNTVDAVHSGTVQLLRAGLQSVCEQAIAQYGDSVAIILTGGMAGKILPLLRSSQIIHHPNLVLQGLHFAVAR